MFSFRERLDTLLSAIAASCGVTLPQMAILLCLHDNAATLKEIRAQLRVNQGNASTVCKRLEQDGLLQKERSAVDERVVHLVLTPKGKAIISNLDAQFKKISHSLDQMPDEQIATAMDSFHQMLQIFSHLDATCEIFNK